MYANLGRNAIFLEVRQGGAARGGHQDTARAAGADGAQRVAPFAKAWRHFAVVIGAGHGGIMLEVVNLPQGDRLRPRQRQRHGFPQRDQTRTGLAHQGLVAFLEQPDEFIELAGDDLHRFMNV